jgi:hypothetical protein
MSLAQIKLDVRNYLEEKDSKLQCMDFKGSCQIVHQDNSAFLLEYVILEERQFGDFKMLLVWTEHNGSFFFFTEDLDSWEYTPYPKHEDETTQERTEGEGSPEVRTDDY